MTTELLRCEFCLFRWVPNPMRGEFVNVGVMLREAGVERKPLVRFARSWRRARAMDPSFDVELVDELAEELAQRLSEKAQDSETRPLLEVVRSSFSNALQVTELQGCLVSSMEAEVERLLRMYVEPDGRRRETGTSDPTGRVGIVRAMRREFENAGVWPLLRHGIPAAEYTAPGDRLRIDCGYLSGVARMFQGVSLASAADTAKVLAFSAGQLREGVRRIDGVGLEMMAVVEPESAIESTSGYRFAVTLMEDASIRVVTTKDMPVVAEMARRELRA